MAMAHTFPSQFTPTLGSTGLPSKPLTGTQRSLTWLSPMLRQTVRANRGTRALQSVEAQIRSMCLLYLVCKLGEGAGEPITNTPSTQYLPGSPPPHLCCSW